MDRRTKILASAFGTLVLYVLLSGVVYPTWIKPQLIIDGRIVERREVLDDLERKQGVVDGAKKEYRRLVARVGSFDVGEVENEVRERLNALIETHGLGNANVSRARTTRDRKTNLQRLLITVSAEARLDAAVGFLKDLAELPHLARVGNLKISPASSRRREKKSDSMNLTVPIEVLVLPRHKLVGRIEEDELAQPESFVRHENRDYSGIWERKPFTEYETLVASAGRSVTVNEGDDVSLQGSARGGIGKYTYLWTPSEGLSDAAVSNPRFVDTSSHGRQEFTLTVTDGVGTSATSRVIVTIRPPAPLVADAGRDVNVEAGKPATLRGSARGGDGHYTWSWAPTEGLNDADAAAPRVVDTTTPGRKKYTLTVTDGAGATATATVTVIVAVTVAARGETVPGWKDRGRMQLRMAMRTRTGATRLDESMIYNAKSKETAYYKVGDEFDGGRLVFVHQTGVLVRRQNAYFVVPLGASLDQDISADQATDYPMLFEVARLFGDAGEATRPTAGAAGQDNAVKRDQPEKPGAPKAADAKKEQGRDTAKAEANPKRRPPAPGMQGNKRRTKPSGRSGRQ